MNDLISIVDADPDLADLLHSDVLAAARARVLTRVRRLSPGEWDAAGAIERDQHTADFSSSMAS